MVDEEGEEGDEEDEEEEEEEEEEEGEKGDEKVATLEGDSCCLFRATVRSIAYLKNCSLSLPASRVAASIFSFFSRWISAELMYCSSEESSSLTTESLGPALTKSNDL